MAAFQASETLVEVTEVLRRLPGTVGGWVSPPPPPPAQEVPFTVQLVGVPVPATVKPKVVLAPAARVPFQDTLPKLWWSPKLVRVASQELPMVEPTARSNSTRQLVIAVAVLLRTVNRAS